MNKKLLVIPAAGIIILSLSACGKFGIVERKPDKLNSSQTAGQMEGKVVESKNTAATNTEKSDGVNSKTEEPGNHAVIDDLIKTLTDMDSTSNSLEDATDEDLKISEP